MINLCGALLGAAVLLAWPIGRAIAEAREGVAPHPLDIRGGAA